jgi:hypothetical protein
MELINSPDILDLQEFYIKRLSATAVRLIYIHVDFLIFSY